MPAQLDTSKITGNNNRRAMALPVVITLFATLSIGIFSLWIVTNQERGASKNFTDNAKAALFADAIHVFLTAEAYASPWSDRFFKEKQKFPVVKPLTGSWADQLQKSVGKMLKKDPWLRKNLDYRGEISSIIQNDQKIIIISVVVENKRTGDLICHHKYYEVYKRDLIDTIGEGVGLLVDATETDAASSEELPPGLALK